MLLHRLAYLLLAAVLLTGACGSPAAVSDGTSAPAATADATEPAAAAAGVQVADSDLGMILVDGAGRTLYLLTGDKQGASTCYDECEKNWPPLAGPAEAGEGADAALLGQAEREDGTLQATYNDWPLYYFAADAQAGDVNGQGVGGVWYVLGAAGEPVKEAGGDEGARDY